jgi:hypothetical protein
MIKKIKNIFSSNSTEEDDTCFCDKCSDSTIKHLKKRRKDLTKKPEGMSQQQWDIVLGKIIHAFDRARSGTGLRSKARQRVLAEQIKEGFELFRVHYKDL